MKKKTPWWEEDTAIQPHPTHSYSSLCAPNLFHQIHVQLYKIGIIKSVDPCLKKPMDVWMHTQNKEKRTVLYCHNNKSCHHLIGLIDTISVAKYNGKIWMFGFVVGHQSAMLHVGTATVWICREGGRRPPPFLLLLLVVGMQDSPRRRRSNHGIKTQKGFTNVTTPTTTTTTTTAEVLHV